MSESGPPPETRGDTAVGEVGTPLGSIDLYRLYIIQYISIVAILVWCIQRLTIQMRFSNSCRIRIYGLFRLQMQV